MCLMFVGALKLKLHIYTYTHTYKHACMHTHRYIHTYMYAWIVIDACIHARTHAYMHACVHACTHACEHTCMHTCIAVRFARDIIDRNCDNYDRATNINFSQLFRFYFSGFPDPRSRVPWRPLSYCDFSMVVFCFCFLNNSMVELLNFCFFELLN